MEDLYLRINAIVPDASCHTRDGVILVWYDERTQPTNTQLLEVDVDVIKIEMQEKDTEINEELTLSSFSGITFDQAESFITNNVSDAGSALVMKKMARLLIAIGKKQGLIK